MAHEPTAANAANAPSLNVAPSPQVVVNAPSINVDGHCRSFAALAAHIRRKDVRSNTVAFLRQVDTGFADKDARDFLAHYLFTHFREEVVGAVVPPDSPGSNVLERARCLSLVLATIKEPTGLECLDSALSAAVTPVVPAASEDLTSGEELPPSTIYAARHATAGSDDALGSLALELRRFSAALAAWKAWDAAQMQATYQDTYSLLRVMVEQQIHVETGALVREATEQLRATLDRQTQAFFGHAPEVLSTVRNDDTARTSVDIAASKELADRISGQMSRAFWDRMKTSLETKEHEPVIELISHAKDRMLALVVNERSAAEVIPALAAVVPQ